MFTIGAVLLVVAVFILLADVPALAVMVGILGAAVIVGGVISAPSAKAKRMGESYYVAAIAEWESRYYCHQCGAMGRAANAT
jgi:hypothetical protein